MVGRMSASVTIGEFSRLSHLTVKTLRHYHEQGLLVPCAVDEASGYPRYSIDQVPDALLIGRLRRLEMPLVEIRRVLASPDTAERDAAIAGHLRRMEAELSRTRRSWPRSAACSPRRRPLSTCDAASCPTWLRSR